MVGYHLCNKSTVSTNQQYSIDSITLTQIITTKEKNNRFGNCSIVANHIIWYNTQYGNVQYIILTIFNISYHIAYNILFTILLFTVVLDFCMLPYSAAPLLAIFKISYHIAYNILFTILLFMYITILGGAIGWWRIYLGRNSLHTDGRQTTV